MSKVILVTGASSGFGKFTALELIKKGYTVYGAARRLEQMKELVQQGGFAIKMDVTSEQSVADSIATIIKKEGRIDALVNNAGYGAYGFIETTNIDQMKRMFEVNVWGAIRVSQHVLPHMRKAQSGSIINISSIVGKVSTAFLGFYAASKHAVEAISDAMRQEVGRFGINVSIIEPGAFSTGFDDVVLKELEEVHPGPAYQPIVDSFIPYFRNMYEKAPTPEPVVKAIVSAIESKKPKTRQAVGSDAKGGIMMKGLLGDRTFDNIMLGQMKMK
ncbi:MAG TPA: short-chain dehydrogenase/reductase [Cytophagales bacterium]|nr:short-chain dehydrogenase/reductase [Cytophagales bacterium]HAA17491.1 short-chain dehydrogenase/reductase [Cytophagales bacterium]HAP61072.1 short-chain dehydrogenase/reductase [Cytophagales bacterium]